MKINKNIIISDFEIIKMNFLNLNNKLVNNYLELFSSDPDNMPDFKYVNKLNNFLNKINSNYICVNKLDVNNEGEIKWEFKLK
tara:strand:- start:1240 stop:1488 length:249 start_codon:yes stop_codon:yes gene_type:complete